MKKLMKVTNSNGITFNVKAVFKGEGYGVNKSIIHDKDDFLIEFYDATYAGKNNFGKEGQFISRYYASTLLEGRSAITGLSLYGSVPAWSLTSANMQKVRTFILKFVPNRLEG